MAEIGVVASIVGVAAVGFRLSLILNAVGCEIASAGVEIHSISKGVTMFAMMLKQVGVALQDSESVHSLEAVETAQEIADQCQVVFNEIDEMLNKVTSRRSDGQFAPTIQQRFKWCFKKGRVQYLLAQLESLKLSLLVMLQILQLGKTMAVPVKSAPKEDIEAKNDAIAAERLEVQNMVVVRYWQVNKMDRLFSQAEREEDEEYHNQIDQSRNSSSRQIANGPPPEYSLSNALIRLPIVSLGELDVTLSEIKESPRDMMRVSESVIDPLLARWTDWQDALDHHEMHPAGRYSPSVQSVHEFDESKPRYSDEFPDDEDSSRGYYLEGVTTDWRKPHSTEAKQDYNDRIKKYAKYQATVSTGDSENEGNRKERSRELKSPAKTVIDLDGDTSDSEPERGPRQRSGSNAAFSNERRPSRQPRSSLSQSYGNNLDYHSTFGGRASLSPNGTPNSTPRSSISAPRSPITQRPQINPGQAPPYHHAYTSPLPPLYTGPPPIHNPAIPTPHSPFAQRSPVSHPQYPGYPGYPPPPTRLMPPQFAPGHPMPMGMPPPLQRPGSQDGHPHRSRSPPKHSSRKPRSRRSEEELRKREKSRKKKNFTKGATSGILGAGALATFIESIEGLEF